MDSSATWFRVDRDRGRVLEAVVTGPADAPLLVWHVGTPMAASPFPALDEVLNRRHLRVVTYSRPGYAASTPVSGRSVADAAADTAAIAAALDAESYLTIGWSGGGPHSLACAALSDGHCRAAATVGSVAPYGAQGLDWFSGMANENVEEFSAAFGGAEHLGEWLLEPTASLAHIEADDLAESFGGLVSDVDRAALDGDFAAYIATAFQRAGTAGVAGWRDDDLAFARDWGFDLQDIDVPVVVWHGVQDRMVPCAHGQWLAEHIPGAQMRLHDDEGHLSLVVNRLEDIVDDLMAIARQ